MESLTVKPCAKALCNRGCADGEEGQCFIAHLPAVMLHSVSHGLPEHAQHESFHRIIG
jgi:hypothetical protein